MKKKFRLAACQMEVRDDKEWNIKRALEMLDIAAKGGADAAVLPEMFNCPYQRSKFKSYSEPIPDGHTTRALSLKAKELGIVIFGGSIPEADEGKVYNTSIVFSGDGRIIGKYRKIHLFDIDIPGKVKVTESAVLSPGDSFLVVDTGLCKTGVAICYDMRFPELSLKMATEGAELIVMPGAFTVVTGSAHWELTARTRAVDNQVFFAAVSPSRSKTTPYKAYGHSMIISPWGEVLSSAGIEEEVIFADVDLAEVTRIRGELPLLKHRRKDLY